MREFRAQHDAFTALGVTVAGVSLDGMAANRQWAERLKLPFPLLSDERREAGEAFGIIRRVGIGSWRAEFFRRSTLLIDEAGKVAAVWSRVKLRGHALEVLRVTRALVRAA